MSEMLVDLDVAPPVETCVGCADPCTIPAASLLALRQMIQGVSAVGDKNLLGWLLVCGAIDGGSGISESDGVRGLVCSYCAAEDDLLVAQALRAAVIDAIDARLGRRPRPAASPAASPGAA